MKIGRRPVYIMGLLIAMVGSIIGAVQTNWGVWVTFNVFWVRNTLIIYLQCELELTATGSRMRSEGGPPPNFVTGHLFCAPDGFQSRILGTILQCWCFRCRKEIPPKGISSG